MNGWASDVTALRRHILAMQAGATPDCEALLHVVRQRWQQRFGFDQPATTALFMVKALGHTYHPRRCPRRWLDAVLDCAWRSAVTNAPATVRMLDA